MKKILQILMTILFFFYFTVIGLFNIDFVQKNLDLHPLFKTTIGIIFLVIFIFIAIWALKAILLFKFDDKKDSKLIHSIEKNEEWFKFYYSFTYYALGVFIFKLLSSFIFGFDFIIIISLFTFILLRVGFSNYARKLENSVKETLIEELPRHIKAVTKYMAFLFL